MEPFIAFIKTHKVLFTLLLVLLLQMLSNAGFLPWGGLWMRMQTKNIAHADTTAEREVTAEVVSQVAGNLREKYPTKTDAELNSLAYNEIYRRWDSISPLVDRKTELRAGEYRDFFSYERNKEKYPYPYNIDSFYFLRYARNIANKGIYGDKEVAGKQFDTHIAAPFGFEILTFSPHPYVLAWLYKVLKFFSKDIPFEHATGYFPVILVFLSIMVMFFFAYLLSGLHAAFVASLFFGILASAVARTQWGDVDTDAYNLFFPLFVLLIFSLALNARKFWQKTAFVACIGFLLGLYSIIWQGWWFVFYLISGVLAAKCAYEFLLWHSSKEKSVDLKNSIGLLVFLLFFSGLFVSWFWDFSTFFESFGGAFKFRKTITASSFDVWPNVYSTVAELKGAPLHLVIQSSGGILIYFIAMLSLGMIVWRRRNEQEGIVSLALLLWLAGMLYATTHGIRFGLMLAVPVAAGFGAGAGMLAQKYRHSRIFSCVVIVAALLLIVLSQQPKGAYKEVTHYNQILNDAWFEALDAIRKNSTQDAIITSWWDYGHIFKYVADRGVTFDGGSQQTVLSYWVARMFTTSNEQEALGILQMLDCGSNNTIELLEDITGSPVEAMYVLDEVLLLGKEEANKILDKKNASIVLQYVKCEPPEAFVIVSGDMILKSGVWGRFGLWNVSMAAADNNYNPPVVSYDKSVKTCSNETGSWTCSGITVNLSSLSAVGKEKTYPVITLVNNTLVSGNISDSTAVLLLIPTAAGFDATLANTPLAKSMFTRLFYFQGKELKHFKQFNMQQSSTQGTIIVYKVEW